MKIANLTQHPATLEQTAAGVEDLPASSRQTLADLLTFSAIPTPLELQARAEAVVTLATALGYESAMIGGAPFFMAPLERAAADAHLHIVYAFSVRETIERTQPDGSVRKISVFTHVGFVHVFN